MRVIPKVRYMFYIEVVGLDGAGKSKLCGSLIYKLGDQARLRHVPSKDC